MRFILPALAAATLITAPASAQQQAPAGEFVSTLSSQAFAVLKDKSLSRTEAKTKFRALLAQNFATKQIGDRLIRTVRSTLTPQQYAAYSAAFPDYVVGAYADRLYEYADATLKVVRVQPVGSGFAVYSSVTQPGQGRPLEAVWSVVPAGAGKFQITNLTVGGINLALTQEADFKSVIQRQGFDALVTFMKSKG